MELKTVVTKILKEYTQDLNELGTSEAFMQQLNDRLIKNEYFEVGLYKIPENYKRSFSGKYLEQLINPDSETRQQNMANRPEGYQEVEMFRTSKSVNQNFFITEQEHITGSFVPLGLYFISDGIKNRVNTIVNGLKSVQDSIDPEKKFLIPIFELNLKPYDKNPIRWDSKGAEDVAKEHQQYLTARETKTQFHSMGTNFVLVVERNALQKALLVYGQQRNEFAKKRGLIILDKWEDIYKYTVSDSRRETIDINKLQKQQLTKPEKRF